MPLLESGDKILLPARVGFIAISMIVALTFNLVPWPTPAAMPDLVALVIAFWAIHQPRRVGISVAWLLGLLMDTANGALIGQHALGYAVLAFLGNGLSRRVLVFPVLKQALHVLPMLLTAQVVMLVVRLVAGGTFPGMLFFLGSVISTALWPVASFILLAPQRASANVDETRPI
jgi:rod shape-determining protein MreD